MDMKARELWSMCRGIFCHFESSRIINDVASSGILCDWTISSSGLKLVKKMLYIITNKAALSAKCILVQKLYDEHWIKVRPLWPLARDKASSLTAWQQLLIACWRKSKKKPWNILLFFFNHILIACYPTRWPLQNDTYILQETITNMRHTTTGATRFVKLLQPFHPSPAQCKHYWSSLSDPMKDGLPVLIPYISPPPSLSLSLCHGDVLYLCYSEHDWLPRLLAGCACLPACQRQVQGLASLVRTGGHQQGLEWLYPCCPTSSSAVWRAWEGGGGGGLPIVERMCGNYYFSEMIMKVLQVYIEKKSFQQIQ